MKKVTSVEFIYNGWYVLITEMRIEAFKELSHFQSEAFYLLSQIGQCIIHHGSSNFDAVDVILECDSVRPFK